MRESAHRRGVRAAASIVAVTGALAGVAPNALAAVRVTVRPATGGVHTRFAVRFRNPSRAGTSAGFRRTERLVVAGPRGRGCESSAAYGVRPAAAGAAMRVTVAPARGHHWCTGRFHGSLVLYQGIVCDPSPARACPLIEIAPETVGRFSFRVRAASTTPGTGGSTGTGGTTGPGGSGGSGGTPGGPPTFAGLQSASFCSGTPLHGAPSGRTYTLRWDPATDAATASAQIVYDIYFSATAGGENFASPTWTTGPGATGYSGNLATSGSAYFVVRARDTAGREDANTVERLAVNTC